MSNAISWLRRLFRQKKRRKGVPVFLFTGRENSLYIPLVKTGEDGLDIFEAKITPPRGCRAKVIIEIGRDGYCDTILYAETFEGMRGNTDE